jgi:hypothetical protein
MTLIASLPSAVLTATIPLHLAVVKAYKEALRAVNL